jgi:hypothetical protein
MKYLKNYKKFNEDGNATVSASTSGMGAVVSSQPGALPGTTGTEGSGDVGFTFKKERRKKGGPSKVTDMRDLEPAKGVTKVEDIKESKYDESRDQFEEDKSFISDTLLELQDRGFRIRIAHDGIARSFSITEPMPIFIIDSFKRVGGRVYFTFSDVKDELLQIKSYLGDRWFKCGVIFEGNPERFSIDINEETYDNLDIDFNTEESGIVNLAVFFNIK